MCQQIINLIQQVLKGDQKGALLHFQKMFQGGLDGKLFLNDILEVLYLFSRRINLGSIEKDLFISENEIDLIESSTKGLNNEDLALFWQITLFTLAHSVTLAMASLGIIKISASIVEPLIAASIVYLAIENFYSKALTVRRSVVILCFGLLHGLGFASVLADFGLPIYQFVPALIGFNVGVELGQITVILILFCAISYWFKNKNWYRNLIALPFSSVVGLVGLFWFFERIL